jgi:UDP-glucose 4-epimerase
VSESKPKRPSARARPSPKPPSERPQSGAHLRPQIPAEEPASAEAPDKKRASARRKDGAATPPERKTLRPAASRDPDAQAVEGAILVTGICGRLGRLLARRLHRIDRVIGVDRRAFVGKPKDVVHHQIDLRRKKTRDIFRAGGIRAVVHLGIMHDPRASAKAHHSWNVVAFQKLLEYMTQYDVPKLVVLSSANVYGPSPDNPQFLTEEAPLLGAQHFSAIRDLVEVDMLAQSFFWRHPDTDTVVLRPCHILGSVRNAPSNYLRLEHPVTLMGFDPMVQVIHERDVVEAIILALQPGVRGIFNLKGPGEVPMSRVLQILGRRPRPVPASLARPVLERMWRYRITSFPTPELDHIQYVCMVDDTRAREILRFDPRFSLEDTVRAVLE